MKKTFVNKLAKLLFQTVTAGLMLCAALAHATGLQNVTSGAGNFSLTAAADPNADAIGGGTPLASTGGQFYSYDNGNDDGYVYSYVYGPGVDPLNTLGGDTFVYFITNGGSGNVPALELGQLQIGSPSDGTDWGTTVEMGYAPTRAVPFPSTASLSLDSEAAFNWNPPAGVSYQYYVVVGTAQQNYELGTAIVGDGSGGDSGTVSVLTPVAAPEPSTAALFVPLGSGVVYVLRKRRAGPGAPKNLKLRIHRATRWQKK